MYVFEPTAWPKHSNSDKTIKKSENYAELTQDQDQTVDQDNFVEFGDDTADLDAANVAIPIALPINVIPLEELADLEDLEPQCVEVIFDFRGIRTGAIRLVACPEG